MSWWLNIIEYLKNPGNNSNEEINLKKTITGAIAESAKEIRKRRFKTKSRHFGEYFVYFWLLFFLVSSGFVWFSPNYAFDDLMASIMTITLALVVIYTGGIIHKP